MATQWGRERHEAFLWPCPRCATRNGLNAARCWRCEAELPPPCADALIAAWNALASEPRRLVSGVPTPFAMRDLVRGSGPSPGSPAATAHAVDASPASTASQATAAATDAMSCAPATDAILVPSAPTGAPVPAGPRTIEIVDLDFDDGDVDPMAPPRASAPHADAPVHAAATHERFGLLADDTARPRGARRYAWLAAAGGAFLLLTVAGYPVYRGAERSLAASGGPPRHPGSLAYPSPRPQRPAVASGATALPGEAHGVMPVPRSPTVEPEHVRPALATTDDVGPARVVPKASPPPAVRSDAAARTPTARRHVARTSHHVVRPTRLAHARRAPAAPVVVAGEVSLHDAALGR